MYSEEFCGNGRVSGVVGSLRTKRGCVDSCWSVTLGGCEVKRGEGGVTVGGCEMERGEGGAGEDEWTDGE